MSDTTRADTTVKKVTTAAAPVGAMGQRYLASGMAELEVEGQHLVLEPGDCWVIPEGARHSYRIVEPFTAVEATSRAATSSRS